MVTRPSFLKYIPLIVGLWVTHGCFEATPFDSTAGTDGTMGGDLSSATVGVGTDTQESGTATSSMPDEPSGPDSNTSDATTGVDTFSSTSIDSTTSESSSGSSDAETTTTITTSSSSSNDSTSNTSNDSTSSTSDDSNEECMPGESHCPSPTQQQDCGPLGLWEPPQICVDQTCIDDHCRGECAPEQVRCQGNAAQRCDTTGQWTTQDLCNGPGQYCEAGECRQCSPWAKQIGTLGRDSTDSAYGIALDSSSHVYVTGITDGILPESSGSKGNTDAFLLKFSPDGKSYWTHHFGSSDGDFGNAIAVDASGQVVVAGDTNGALPEGGGSNGHEDAFVVQYNSNGKLQWTQQFGTDNRDRAEGVAIDVSGNIYITGTTEGPLAEGGNAAPRSEDVFVAKYSPDGEHRWTRQHGSPTPDSVKGIAVDTTGHVYITGHISGARFGSGDSAENNIALVMKFNSNGNLQWAQQYDPSEPHSPYGIALDASGQVYIVGETEGALPNGGGSAGKTDAFVMKYNSNGTLQWTKQFGTSEPDSAFGIAVDASGQIYVAGDTEGVLPDGGGSLGQDDAFVVKLNPTGTLQWTKQLGSNDRDNVVSIAVDAAGRSVYITGYTEGTWPDGGGSAGGTDAFVQHLCVLNK